MILCDGSCGISHDGFSGGNVSCYDRSCTDDCAYTNPYSWKNDGASSNKSEFAHCHLTGESCPGCNMGTIADNAVVIDGRLCIDNDCLTEAYACTYRAHGQNLAAITHKCIFGNECSWVDYAKNGVVAALEPMHALQSITPEGTADGHASVYLKMITIPLLPLRKSLFTVKNRNISKRRDDIAVVKESNEIRIVNRQCISQYFRLSCSAPENDGYHC